MIAPAAYVLNVPENRRETLLGPAYYTPDYAEHWQEFWKAGESVAEPVPWFDHSRRAPLIVFASFDHGMITHIADGRKGASAGTGLVRLNMSSFQPLARPIPFGDLLERTPKKFRRHLKARLESGGKLPPKSLGALIDTILQFEPGVGARLERFSKRRAERLSQLTPRGRSNLAQQKEALSTALDIAGIDASEVLNWSPGEGAPPRSFLEGMPQAYLREDAALISDYSDMPGFDIIKKYPFAARQFQATNNSNIQLKVIMANRLPLEEQTGADLIYYNETFKSFVMVQYKSMNHSKRGAEFRWTPKDKLSEEIARMDGLLEALSAAPHDPGAASFRLHSNPFFLKLCPRLVFNPDDKGLAKGMYFPLDFWKALAADDMTKGPRDGRVITYDNVTRRLNNTEFISLVAQAWVGTTVPQSLLLERVIESVIQTGKTVTLAVKPATPSRAAEVAGADDVEDGNESVDWLDIP